MRELAIALRCQLLTGSYKGASRSCECESPQDCALTGELRQIYCSHTKIKVAKERNWFEFLDEHDDRENFQENG